MAQDTNLPIVNPADNFDQRVQDYLLTTLLLPLR